MNTDGASPARPPAPRLAWLEGMKAAGLLWVFLNHVVERSLDGPLIGNPGAGWPPFAVRLHQLLTPLQGHGWADVPLNVLRYAGWFGDQGVSLFLVASGVGLTWGLLHRSAETRLPLLPFYRRRAERIYPLWWAVHALAMFAVLFLGATAPLTAMQFLVDLTGLRVQPGTLYAIVPAWWYISLLVQLYLIYPVLWTLLRRYGPLRLLLGTLLIAIPVRAAGLLYFHSYLDAWSRGAIFITRLPEFVLGVCLAAWWHEHPAVVRATLRRTGTLVGAAVLYLVGTALSLSLGGMAIAPVLLAAASFVLLFRILDAGLLLRSRAVGPVNWLGEHSYSLYLVHQPLVAALLPAPSARIRFARILLGMAAAFGSMLLAGRIVERATEAIRLWLAGLHQQLGWKQVAVRLAGGVLLVATVLVTAELASRRFAPQEVYGWGERPSLVPDAELTYHLRPSSSTRLRWSGYDYTVTANALGYPAPEFPDTAPLGTFRILTVGDAFTSAEGVNTDQAWPRLLEHRLNAAPSARRVQVLNFGITGYGPNQYAAVVRRFVPRYRPNLVIIGFFVNDYQDVLRSEDSYREGIGFGRRDPNSVGAIIRLANLRQFWRREVVAPIVARIRRQPEPDGYFLGNFRALERAAPEYRDGVPMVAARLRAIKAVTDAFGGQVMIAMIPAPVQVCAPSALKYYPNGVDLRDTSRFDVNEPQRVTRGLAAAVGIQYVDLRPALEHAAGGCPYQPANMHWTEAGHVAAADTLAELLRGGVGTP